LPELRLFVEAQEAVIAACCAGEAAIDAALTTSVRSVAATAYACTIAMLLQRPDESMLQLLDRLEFAIIEAIATGYVVDEVNGNVQSTKKSRRK
jgi:uncharacterized membrane protein